MRLAANWDLRPTWLRPATLALVVAAHFGLLLVAQANINPPPSLDAMEVALVPEGDATVDQAPREEIKPQEETAESPVSPPAQSAELTAPPPRQATADAPPLPLAKPKPISKPKPEVEDDDEPRPAELREIQRKKRLAEQRRREERKAQEARQEAHRGAAGGARAESGLSSANFAGLVIAQLNRHKFYPAAAQASGATGSVGVAFTIGPSGRVISQSVIRSSGSSALDSAAHAIMSSLQTPPPPGGRFSTSTNINFHMR
ncbi:hypothetical protein CCR94_21690 [Rhodoblastus sphagnicola]|uniref:Protein TonB n=1 Tax=Rhodoblastus sphagnicola TaxID=333368 RepID=A0A2S6MWI6_9HYPH|nr:TonB family protein [Rhodoblastus sphagnicola]MBB4200012.1 protein TonB [Rhodoblastus sphagnicola]PPQ26725.1 hypothetical protein CCR94_21690 [Rhodoblastus sphagnicola]